MQYKIDFNTMDWTSPAPGIRAKACQPNGTQLRLVEYTPEMEPHWCPKGHIGYVLEGRMEITIADAVMEFNAGDGVFLPPGEKHQHMARILSDVVRVVFVEEV